MTRELLLPLNMGENFTLCLPPAVKAASSSAVAVGLNARQRGLPLKIGVGLPARIQGKFAHRNGHRGVNRFIKQLVIQRDIAHRAGQLRFSLQKLCQTFRRDCVKRRRVVGKNRKLCRLRRESTHRVGRA